MKDTHRDDKVPPARPHLIYFAPVDLQMARVDRNCIVKFCEAVAEDRAQVTLVSLKISVLDSEPTAKRGIWDVFGVEHEFELVNVPVPLRQAHVDGPLGSVVVRVARALVYPVVAARLLLRDGDVYGLTVMYAKNYGLVPGLLLAKALRPRRTVVVFEDHVPPRNRFQAWALKKVDGVVCNGYAVCRVLGERGLIRPNRAIALHQGFNLAAYPAGDRAAARSAARSRLGWAETDKVAAYTGKVYWPYAEVELLMNAASQLAADGVRMVIVGGRADHAQIWRDEAGRRGLGNVSFVGFVAPSEIVDYQVAADVLLSYYPSGIELNDYRSPGKLFEYMASGTPIVAGDYASLREVLEDGRNSLLVPPDRPELLSQAVRRLLDDPSYAARLAAQARDDVGRFTWAARAASFLAFVGALERG